MIDLKAPAFGVGDAALAEDMIAIVPSGSTSPPSVSMTRIGLSALVTIRRVDSSVATSAVVSSGRLVTPALTKMRSNLRGGEPVAKSLDLLRRVAVDVLDLQPPAGSFLQLVQGGAVPAADGRHDLGSPLEVRRGDRVAQARGRTDQRTVAFSETGLMTAPGVALSTRLPQEATAEGRRAPRR